MCAMTVGLTTENGRGSALSAVLGTVSLRCAWVRRLAVARCCALGLLELSTALLKLWLKSPSMKSRASVLGLAS